MLHIKQSEAESYQGDGYSGMDYPMTDPNINFAVIKISSRSPKIGYQVNTACKELLYIMDGTGTLYLKEKEETIFFEKGDVLFIEMGECYAFEGNFEAAVPCTPAWTSNQHKYLN